MNECSILGCSQPTRSRGWCLLHYTRWRRHGDPEWFPTYKVIERRLEDYPPPTPQPTPCRLWQREVDRHGYGRRYVRGSEQLGQHRNESIHRWVWEQVNGPIPEGMHVLHRCDNPPCYRLDHLWLGTHADNMRDMAAKGRKRGGWPKPEARDQ